MRKKTIIFMLLLTTALIGLTACSKTANEEVSGPAVLQGRSEHWVLTVNYLKNGNDLEEQVVVQSTVKDENLSEAAVTITHKGQEPAVYAVVEPAMLLTGNPITLYDKSAVKSWKDVEQAVVEWKVGDVRNKEYITLENKAAAAK